MLKLENIKKDFKVGSNVVHALNGIDTTFRKSEFVSILGPSGGGKTTLLNLIGGLDKPTSGDMKIDGRSTKNYKDREWDRYRNHSVGFVFQTYNLIPHQSVLVNVELALTIAGVSRSERKSRAITALEKVGLGDQIRKRPSQLSGGQMQRVSIARALINDPEIMLADEPTGALDTKTGYQIMELLKEIAKDRLVIMVTHNSELAEKYSTRIVNLVDGKIVSDSNPVSSEREWEAGTEEVGAAQKKKLPKKVSMSFFTAVALSFRNLMTKKGRTILTAFAGSIGIIGIALVLSLSSGTNEYIKSEEEKALASYPLTIQASQTDIGSMLSSMMGGARAEESEKKEKGKINSHNLMKDVIDSMTEGSKQNDLESFREHLIENEKEIEPYVQDISYSYDTPLIVYKKPKDDDDKIVQVNPSPLMSDIGLSAVTDMQSQNPIASSLTSAMGGGSGAGGTDIFMKLLEKEKMRDEKYEVLAGKMPEKYNEVVLITDSEGGISDYTLYTLGLKSKKKIMNAVTKINAGKKVNVPDDNESYSYEEFLGLKLSAVAPSSMFEKEGDVWVDKSEDDDFLREQIDEGISLKVVGIAQAAEDENDTTSAYGVIGYNSSLQKKMIEKVRKSEVAKAQMGKKKTNIFTGEKFSTSEKSDDYADILENMSTETQMEMMAMPEAERMEFFQAYQENINATYDDNIAKIGLSNLKRPAAISIYPIDFDSKDEIVGFIDDYNEKVEAAGDDDKVIEYSDLMGMLMSSVTTIINSVTSLLVGFIAISLVVSSIMIGIITYISVLERRKEIGILRSIGASKGNISSVFNAETLITGFVSGVLGIGVSLLLNEIISVIVLDRMDIENIATLPLEYGGILILISMLLTFIAGLIPSRIAAGKDPAVALRTE